MTLLYLSSPDRAAVWQPMLAAQTLGGLGFPVTGYSRSGTPVDGIKVFGGDALAAFLAGCDLVICLLPLTDATRGMMDQPFFAHLPRGALLVHAGRGAQLDMDALRKGLESGQIGGAMLDVTDPEPLPADHWAWRQKNLLITPHIAAHTDAEEGARHVLAVLAATRDGDPVPGLVDQRLGY